MNNDFLSNTDAAKLLCIAPTTLNQWRWKGESPPFLKVGKKRILYQKSKILEWLGERECQHTSEYTQKFNQE